ncbi:MAG: hypothetical protein M1828_005752 [Chrysothrix sp. TS-e1954]|nr:MAG: hypothetical protein M1828_005752 [Chrysothrix sp. TS-e1954]
MWRQNISLPGDPVKSDPKAPTKVRNTRGKLKSKKVMPASLACDVAQLPLAHSPLKAEDGDLSDLDLVAALSPGESVTSSDPPGLASCAHMDSLTFSPVSSPVMTCGRMMPGTIASHAGMKPTASDVVTTNFLSDSAFDAVDPMSLTLDAYAMDENGWQQAYGGAESGREHVCHLIGANHAADKNTSTGVRDFAPGGFVPPSVPEATQLSQAFSTSEHSDRWHINDIGKSDGSSPRSQSLVAATSKTKARSSSTLKRPNIGGRASVSTASQVSEEAHVSSPESVPQENRSEDDDDFIQGRNSDVYDAKPHADGLYHCYFEGKEDCPHEPTKLKCNYEYGLSPLFR